MHVTNQISRAVRTEWLVAKDNNFRINSHPRKRGRILIEADKKYKVHGIDTILNLLKYGLKLDKDWASDALCNDIDDKISIDISSSNPIYLVAEALDTYQVCYPRSEEIFNIGHVECISLINEVRDYKALCHVPVSEEVAIPYYPCTIHLVEMDNQNMFIPVTMNSINRGMGRYHLDMENYFVLINPIGLEAFRINGMMMAIPMDKVNERIGSGILQIIKEIPGTRESDEYDEMVLNKYMYNLTSH